MSNHKFYFIFSIVIICIFALLFNQQINTNDNFNKLNYDYQRLKINYTALSDEVEKFRTVLNFSEIGFGSSIREVLTLHYFRLTIEDPPTDIGEPIAIIYVFKDNLTLNFNLVMPYFTPGLKIPLSVQKGDAFDPKYATESIRTNIRYAPILWREDATRASLYHVNLQEKGWYTFSIVGPIYLGSGRGEIGIIRDDENIFVLSFNIELVLYVTDQNSVQTIFALNEFRSIGWP